NSFASTARAIDWQAGGGGFDIDDAGHTFTVSQSLGGTGGLVKSGAGTLVLSATNTFTGLLDVAEGTVALTGGAAVGDTTAVNVGAAGALRVDQTETIGTLSGDAGGVVDVGA